MTYDDVEVAVTGVTVGRLIWRLHRTPMPGLLEETLEANPGLADLGAELPVGTHLRIPRPETQAASVTVVRLWD